MRDFIFKGFEKKIDKRAREREKNKVIASEVKRRMDEWMLDEYAEEVKGELVMDE